MEHNNLRIAVASAQRFFVTGLRTLICAAPEFSVESEATSFDELLLTLYRRSPDLVVLDAPLLAGISDAVRDLLQDVRVILLTDGEAHRFPGHWRTRQILKSQVQTQLIPAMRNMLDAPTDEVRASLAVADLQALARSTNQNNSIPGLTGRENEIVRLLAEGHTARSVAQELTLSVKTVEAHKLNIMRKLNVHNRTALIACASEYIDIPDRHARRHMTERLLTPGRR